MEDKLKGIIERIDTSTLSGETKTQLYTAIGAGLQASIWPILLTHLPQGEADALLAETDAKKRVERYSELIATTMEEGNALDEIDETMNKLLDEVDTALREEHI